MKLPKMTSTLGNRSRAAEPLQTDPGWLARLPREALSLLAAGLDDKRPIEYGVLPLDPAKKSQAPLRQRVKTLPAEFWKEPVATPPRP